MHKRVACSLGSFGSLPSHKSLIKADSSLRSRYSCWHQMKTRESVFIISVSLNCGSSCYDNALTNINVYLFKINHALWSVPLILSEVSTIQKQRTLHGNIFSLHRCDRLQTDSPDGRSWLFIHCGQQLAQEASLSPRSPSLSTALYFLHKISNKQRAN